MKNFDALIGKRVRNAGDVCNASREGTVTEIKVTPWGTDALIRWDEPEAIGWERDGTPVLFNEAVSSVSAHSIDVPGTRYARFALI
jgi:hypothetical protein